MGFLSKIAKGLKKVVKKIGKGIKSAFKKVGKFMGKIGILGQIAMSFILPGIGGALMKGLGSAFSGAVGTMLGSGSAILRGAGHVLKAAGNFAKVGHSAFKTVTGAVGSFVKEFAGTALKQIPGMEKLMPKLANSSDSFFGGTDSAFSRVQDNIAQNGSKVVESFNKAIGYTPPPAAVTSKVTSTLGTGAAKSVSVPDATLKTESLVDTLGPEETLTSTSSTTTSLLESQSGLQSSSASSVLAPDNVITGAQQSVIGEGVTAKVAEDPSFLSKLGTSTKDAVMSIPDKIIEAPGKFVDGLDNTVQKGLQNKVLVESGLVDSPVQNVTYEGSTVVPQMADTPFMNQYASSAINDRAYQMSVNPTGYSMSNPWGSPANTYQQELGARYG